jgi:hypothetical protein
MSNDLLQDQIRLIGREANLIFDVGAHTGQSTLEYLINFPNARVFAFEPDATNVAALAATAIIANGVAFTTWLYRTQMAPLSFIAVRPDTLFPRPHLSKTGASPDIMFWALASGSIVTQFRSS